ncbi:WD40-repeat-containing domain protein [Phakopsora pachyrhizi]|uniref:WD40-repeat-containing domain protein n=1 Tax=Phakopsora pachyrhizi TaxID=170000 RepID=A0AAV0AS45_PHAPC|nr:WD40-repeat-containing domain protein [Phakopsora pachyrhizi]
MSSSVTHRFNNDRDTPDFLLKPNPFEFQPNNFTIDSIGEGSSRGTIINSSSSINNNSSSNDPSNSLSNASTNNQSNDLIYTVSPFGVLDRSSSSEPTNGNEISHSTSENNQTNLSSSVSLSTSTRINGYGVPGGGDCKKLCPRHQRMANEGTNRALQSEIEELPQSDQEAISTVWGLFSASNSKRRRLILSGILTMCCPSQLSFLTDSIKDACRTDPFIRLPKEISLNVLSYLDAFSIGRAAQVSRLWRKLADDDLLWRSMCQQHIERTCQTCGWGLPSMDKTKKRSCTTDHQDHLRYHQDQEEENDEKKKKKNKNKRQKLDGEDSSDQDKGRCWIDEDSDGSIDQDPLNGNNNPSPGLNPKDLRKPWKAVYTERLALERNWRKGSYKESVLTGHSDSITCSQLEDITGYLNGGVSTPILITGSWDKSIKVWDLERLELVKSLVGHTRGVRCLQFDSYKLISGGMDRMLKIWNWRTGQCIRTIEGHSDSVTCLNYDEELLASGSSDLTIRVWNFKTGSGYILRGHSEQINSVKLNSSKKMLYSGSDDNQIKIWDLNSRQTLKVLKGHVAQVQSISFLEKDLCLVSGSFDNCLKVWNLNDDNDEGSGEEKFGRCERTMFGHIQGVWSVDADKLRIVR